MICSLTKAAAAEIGGRDTGIPQQNIGTLHKFALAASGVGTIADAPKSISRWNEWISAEGHPYLQITSTQPDVDENAAESAWGGETLGDQHYGTLQVARARLDPLESLPAEVQNFAGWWNRWTDEEGSLDFTGLLEYCLRYVEAAPGNPSVLMMDEAQDTSMLGMRLLRKWSQAAEHLLIFGDPLQNLYAWAGTDPEAFTTPDIPDAQKHVLSQSYRVPRAVHAQALRWIEPLQKRLEEQIGRPIVYEPRDADGFVGRMDSAYWKAPEVAVDDAERHLAQGRTVMFLASCSHMLAPLLAILRQRGLPFHNPWRMKRGDWNPFGNRTGTTARERLLSYLRLSDQAWDDPRLWTPAELWHWVELAEAAGLLLRGAKQAVEAKAKEPFATTPLSLAGLEEWFDPEALTEAILGSGETCLDWLEQHLLPGKRKQMQFPMTVCRRRGPAALRERPRLIVGTIHSLKGSEADVVYIFPDLSQAAMQEWCCRGSGHDGIRRLFYVGFTRARESLYLCGQTSPLAVEW